jgi:hypothetical protein
LDLFRRGYMQLIYLMLNSLNHISTLAQKKNKSFLQGDAAPEDARRDSGLS